MGWYREWRPYVPVARRRANAASHATKLAKNEGRSLSPVQIEGRKIAISFWGKAWCDNLEQYSDYANRLPRGATYVRNGSVIDLQIARGQVRAIVSGSEIYTIKIDIKTLGGDAWKRIKSDCSASVASLIDLLQGRFDAGIMQRMTEPKDGLFPQPKEIKMSCSCPDVAGLCKHLAAVMYGVGARLDRQPELLFTLRDVDHLELIQQAASAENLDQALVAGQSDALGDDDLGALFGIELESSAANPKQPARAKTARTKKATTEQPTGRVKKKAATVKKPISTARPRAAKARVAASVPAAKKKRPALAASRKRKGE